jgi:bis(5'-nucleosyl)-tetraphosphatase (symmetrical)
MSIYAIGDIQGCAERLDALLVLIHAASPDAQLIFLGDLVNRGPDSLATLRKIRGLGARARVVLGNHDLHLLAVSLGIRKPHPADTVMEILEAHDRDELLTWLRHQSLALYEQGNLLVHAGVLPQWSTTQVLALAQEVETRLRSENWGDFLREMYGNEPTSWNDNLQGAARMRCIVNGLTRLRYCTAVGEMEFITKESPGNPMPGYMPWFRVPNRQTADTTVIFGHWSTLGLSLQDNIIGLDTGCVWGGKLTALRLSDRGLLQVACPQYQRPC